jgi:hypothetical protein
MVEVLCLLAFRLEMYIIFLNKMFEIEIEIEIVFCCSQNGGFFFVVFGKTRILLGNPDTSIEISYKKKNVRQSMLLFKSYSSMNMVNFAIMLSWQDR